MTVQRASRIVLALHYRLIEFGLKPQHSLFIINQLRYSGILVDMVHEYKDQVVQILANDINESLKGLIAKHQIIVSDDKNGSEEWNEQQEDECITLLEIALAVHYEPGQIVGY